MDINKKFNIVTLLFIFEFMQYKLSDGINLSKFGALGGLGGNGCTTCGQPCGFPSPFAVCTTVCATLFFLLFKLGSKTIQVNWKLFLTLFYSDELMATVYDKLMVKHNDK